MPKFKLTTDWFQNDITPPFLTSITLLDHALEFHASRESRASIKPNSESSSFTPELWCYDVAEIFISDPSTGSYLEFNLAPNGAWWACQFDSPRQPSLNQPDFTSIHTQGLHTTDHWHAKMRIPLTLLPPLNSLKFNISAIIDSPQQRFLSLTPLPSPQPDFHLPQHFQPLPLFDPS